MLVYVRHGKTSLNQGGEHERLRGWLPLPLTEEGEQEAHRTGERLRGLEPDTFASSDLPRALQTAQIIGQHIGRDPEPDPQIRDWNTGELAGQAFNDVKKTLFGLVRTPDVTAPGGESMDSYLARFVPPMRERVQDDRVHLVVGHARGTSVLQGIAAPEGGVGMDIDKTFLEKKPEVEPGGMLIIQPGWKTKVINPEPMDGERNS